MSEPQPVYYADIVPTKNELKLLARLRQGGIMIVERDGDMLKWSMGRGWEIPSNGNGHHAPTLEDAIIEARHA